MKHYLFSILVFVFNCAVSCIDDDIVCFTQPGFYKGIPTVSYSCDSHYPPTQPIFNDVTFRTHNTLNTPASCVRVSAEFPENMSVNQLTEKSILKEVIQHGCESIRDGRPCRILEMGNQKVELVYFRSPDGIKITNAWVQR